MKTLKSYAGIFQNVSMPWVLLVLYLLSSVAGTTFFVSGATLSADVIDSAQKAIDISKLLEFLIALVGAALMGIAETYIGNLAFETVDRGVRVNLWSKILRLPTRYFDGENGDSLVSRVTTDASQSHMCFYVIANVISVIWAAVLSIRAMYKYSAQLTNLQLLLLPVSLIASAVFGKLNYLAGQKTQESFAGTMSYLVERTRNLRLVKAARMEYQERMAGAAKFNRQFRVSFLSVFASGSYAIIANVISLASLMITFFLGGRMVIAGELTVGKLTGFYTLSSMISIRLSQIINYYGSIKSANGRVAKIAQVLETPDERTDGVTFNVNNADLTAEGVGFSYDGRSTLEGVSFRIPKGQITAIIGPNGAGKSTMFKLLERMYDPEAGALRFGEDDVRIFDLISWRQSFAIVAQDSPLLSGTVRENILYGIKHAVDEEELIRVAKLANVYDFVMATPGGFDAPVNMGGSNFSGGQRQCIAIARAMMRDPEYLLLDEATSNLDAKSEQLVSQALTNLMKGRTTVMIAHSYSATRDATHIIVMRDGHVEAEGSPEELLDTNDYYRDFAGKTVEF